MNQSQPNRQQIEVHRRNFHWGLNHQYGNHWRDHEPPAIWITSKDGLFEICYQLEQAKNRQSRLDVVKGFPQIPQQWITGCTLLVPRWDDAKPTTSLVRQILEWCLDEKKDLHPSFLRVRSGTDDDALQRMIEQFNGLPSLKELHLHSVGMSNSGMNILSKLRSLHTLSAIRGNITDAGLTCLGSLQNLKSLSLSKIGLTDEGLKHVIQYQKLKDLWLIKTKVTDAGLDDIASLKKLCYIDLTDTLVTAEGRNRLRCLTNAQVLPE